MEYNFSTLLVCAKNNIKYNEQIKLFKLQYFQNNRRKMRSMSGPQMTNQVNFQNAKHHRQVLRQQIKPQLFQKLQVNEQPAVNYKNAFKNVFKDELEKTLEEQYNKKAKDEYKAITDKIVYSLNPVPPPSISRINDVPQQNQAYQNYGLQKSPSLPQLNSQYIADNRSYTPHSPPKFRDYFEERTNKFQNLIKNNYDGGQQFFKVQDAYAQKRMREKQNYAEFLRKQLEMKEYSKMAKQQKENQQKMAFNQSLKLYNEHEREKVLQQREMRVYQGMKQLHEVEEERQRRQRKEKGFQYNPISLHNPITNPIEYHIDNPYILKKIQDKTLV